MKFYKHSLLLFLPVFCCILSGCIKEKDSVSYTPCRTVLVYLGADKDFVNEIPEKINTLKNNWDKNINGNLLVYADEGNNAFLVHIYYNKRLGNVADTIEIYPAENSASPATFTRALNKAKEYCPASSSYGLVVLSHGSGWLPAEMSYDIKLKSVIFDKSTKESYNYMEISDFANAIPYKLDFIIFDVCFMGAVEVCYELKDKADYVVASPAEVWVPGFVYSTMMQHLFAPVLDVTAVAREFYEYYDNRPDNNWNNPRSATVSVVKTDVLEALATVVKDITQQNAPLNDLNNIQTYYGYLKFYFDLEDYLLKLSPENQNQIQTALNKCVTYKACTPSYYTGYKGIYPINTFSGLSVYIPQKATYPLANEEYEKLKWAKRIEYSASP